VFHITSASKLCDRLFFLNRYWELSLHVVVRGIFSVTLTNNYNQFSYRQKLFTYTTKLIKFWSRSIWDVFLQCCWPVWSLAYWQNTKPALPKATRMMFPMLLRFDTRYFHEKLWSNFKFQLQWSRTRHTVKMYTRKLNKLQGTTLEVFMYYLPEYASSSCFSFNHHHSCSRKGPMVMALRIP